METYLSQQPKAIESTNWYQKIAMTICYNDVIRYINKDGFFVASIFKKT